MSAYALPGSLFLPPAPPPTSSLRKPILDIFQDNNDLNWKKTEKDSYSNSDDSLTCCLSKSDSSGSSESSSSIPSSSIPISPSVTATTSNNNKSTSIHPLYEEDVLLGHGEASWLSSKQRNLMISIKSASIDPIRLIQSFSNPSTKNTTNTRNSPSKSKAEKLHSRRRTMTSVNGKSNTTIRREEKRDCHSSLRSFGSNYNNVAYSNDGDDDECWGEYDDNETTAGASSFKSSSSSQNSSDGPIDPFECSSNTAQTPYYEKENKENSYHRLPQERLESSCNNTTNATATSSSNLSDDALQFNLSISFNGRDYTATRALPSFVKLRDDLMKELSSCKEKTVHFRNCAKSTFDERRYRRTRTSMATTPVVIGKTSASSLIAKMNSNEDDDEDNVFIPDLPIGSETSTLVDFAGRGFTRLQAAFNSYCPAMEKWLRLVATMAPTSPILANFLWEPNQEENLTYQELEKEFIIQPNTMPRSGSRNLSKVERNSSLCTLNSITENDGDDDDDDEDVIHP